MKKPRIAEWTELRGIAFLAIVMQHNIAEYIYRADIEQPDSVMLTMIYHLTRFGTPTFVFLSAVMLFYHHRDTKPDYPRFIRKRFGDIYMPFVVWTLIYWLAVRVFTPTFWIAGIPDMRSLVRELFVPQTGYHLWFVIMVFQFYILFPLFWRGAKAIQRRMHNVMRFTPMQVIAVLLLLAAAFYALLMKWSYYNMGAGQNHYLSLGPRCCNIDPIHGSCTGSTLYWVPYVPGQWIAGGIGPRRYCHGRSVCL
ncbi:acyltransferase [Paenibacillus amylolyticus]|nr:acyltransferase [Paenibacillus amylolyticus]WFR62651.1 acyltransferase [Paenibacillus amylolyticus]